MTPDAQGPGPDETPTPPAQTRWTEEGVPDDDGLMPPYTPGQGMDEVGGTDQAEAGEPAAGTPDQGGEEPFPFEVEAPVTEAYPEAEPAAPETPDEGDAAFPFEGGDAERADEPLPFDAGATEPEAEPLPFEGGDEEPPEAESFPFEAGGAEPDVEPLPFEAGETEPADDPFPFDAFDLEGGAEETSEPAIGGDVGFEGAVAPEDPGDGMVGEGEPWGVGEAYHPAEPEPAAEPTAGAPDSPEDLADRLEWLARTLRTEGRPALEREASGNDRITALVAGILAGYLAGREG